MMIENDGARFTHVIKMTNIDGRKMGENKFRKRLQSNGESLPKQSIRMWDFGVDLPKDIKTEEVQLCSPHLNGHYSAGMSLAYLVERIKGRSIASGCPYRPPGPFTPYPLTNFIKRDPPATQQPIHQVQLRSGFVS